MSAILPVQQWMVPRPFLKGQCSQYQIGMLKKLFHIITTQSQVTADGHVVKALIYSRSNPDFPSGGKGFLDTAVAEQSPLEHRLPDPGIASTASLSAWASLSPNERGGEVERKWL